MKKHIIIYHKAFNIPLSQDCFNDRKSELSDSIGTDIHHIERRGMGGSKSLDRIENLIALNNEEHRRLGDKKQYKAMLFEKHRETLRSRNIKFDEQWIQKMITRSR